MTNADLKTLADNLHDAQAGAGWALVAEVENQIRRAIRPEIRAALRVTPYRAPAAVSAPEFEDLDP